MQKIEVISANDFLYDGKLGCKPHAHPFYQIFFTLEGHEDYLYESQMTHVRKGEFLFVKPDKEHGFPVSQPNSRVLDVKFIIRDAELNTHLSLLPAHMRCTQSMCSLFGLIDEASQTKRVFYSNIISDLLEALLYTALCEFCPQYSAAGVGILNLLNRDYSGLSECVQRTLRRIEGAVVLGPDKSVLDDTAQMIGYSKAYMCRRFSEEMGVSIIQYITMLRIDKAKELLIGSDNTVKEIAKLLYFNDSARFCKTFKQYTGVTPSQYRENPSTEDSFLLYSHKEFLVNN